MADTILVTVAEGQTVTVSPHPSGIPGIGPLHLGAGDTLRATPEEADRLWRQGRIRHPVTGEVKQQARDIHPSPTVTYGNGRPIPVTDSTALVIAAERFGREALAAHDRAEDERHERERRANQQGQEKRVAVRVTRHPTGSMDPLGPIAGITPEEGGWA
ncbi:hypothetical protein J8J14_18205 [Roseomonas sp. SSH11]|uniref:Uncharacterized protein n=1 Tax=Pararoseomonas baculiformis TaxID=2820812 RepID=A0ABS4AI51_9PROT|nr:hypothetical protein [Pararoseomonas baculiformis]MBP0446713.1 hypothetical protein [Pararoseomonas baculiformis]